MYNMIDCFRASVCGDGLFINLAIPDNHGSIRWISCNSQGYLKHFQI